MPREYSDDQIVLLMLRIENDGADVDLWRGGEQSRDTVDGHCGRAQRAAGGLVVMVNAVVPPFCTVSRSAAEQMKRMILGKENLPIGQEGGCRN